MSPDTWHLIEGAIMLCLGACLTWFRQQIAGLRRLEIRVVTLEVEAKAQDSKLDKLAESLDYVREHMLRREEAGLVLRKS